MKAIRVDPHRTPDAPRGRHGRTGITAARPERGVVVQRLNLAATMMNFSNFQPIRPSFGPVNVNLGNPGGFTQVQPSYGGGYSIRDSHGGFTQVQPMYGGGYCIRDNNGGFTQVQPTYGGGWNIYSW